MRPGSLAMSEAGRASPTSSALHDRGSFQSFRGSDPFESCGHLDTVPSLAQSGMIDR
jgi:hypothetical protein